MVVGYEFAPLKVCEEYSMYTNGVANESAPDPSVTRALLALPSRLGNLKVLFAAKVSGVVNLTLLPFECVRFSSVSYTHLTLPTIYSV